MPEILDDGNATPIDSGAGFARFHHRAQSGEALSVVFFGGSITWGAGASDPQETSYRALIGKRLIKTYPNARFRFHDAAIGGTGSQLGVFRLDRDVLSRKPDLVFLDFALNDDLHNESLSRLSSYETLLRRIIVEAEAPVVLPMFPYWDVVASGCDKPMEPVIARKELGGIYHAPVGDVIGYVGKQIVDNAVRIEELWPDPQDHTHPGDKGYELYAEEVWRAYEDAVLQDVACAAPVEMIYGDTYTNARRYAFSDLPDLPAGWRRAAPSDDSPVGDMIMSRWLDSVIVAERAASDSASVEPIDIETDARAIIVFGESTPRSGRYEITIDGEFLRIVDAAEIGRIIKGNAHHFHLIADSLAPGRMRAIQITPLLEPGQELRIESIGLSGGNSSVTIFHHLAATGLEGTD